MKHNNHSPLHLFIGILLIIATAEAAIMFLLPLMLSGTPHSLLTEILLDPLLLSLVCAPLLWFWFFRPLSRAYETAYAESHAIIEYAGEAIISIDEQGIITSFNPSAENIFGYPRESVVGKNVSMLMPEPYRSQHDEHLQRYFRTHIARVIGQKRQLEGQRANGEIFPLELAVSEIRRGRRSTFTAVLHDISAYKQVEAQLSQANNLLEQIFSNLPGLVAYMDANFNYIRVNTAYAETHQRTPDYFIGKNHFGLFPDAEDLETFRQVRNSGEPYFAHAKPLESIDRSGRETRYWDCALYPILNDQGEVGNLLLTMSDVTDRAIADRERRDATQKLQYMVHHDTLTGLPNRLLFYDRLEQAVHLAKRNNQTMCLFFVDLDLFKQVNDRLGHAAGDELLCQVSVRLTETVRDSDSVARIAGDEFTVILQQVRDCESAIQVAEKIIARLREPFTVLGNRVEIGASIGIAVYPLDASNMDDMVKVADSAMYEAKRAGRNTWACSAFPNRSSDI